MVSIRWRQIERFLLLRLGLSQQELAELAEIHFTNLGKIERGATNATIITLVRVAGALGIDSSALVTGLTRDMLPERSHGLTAAEFIREREARSRS